MGKIKFTDRWLVSLLKKKRPRAEKHSDTVANGLIVRVSPRGKVNWQFRYNDNGREGTFGLGSYPDVSLREARELVRRLEAELAEGQTPRQARDAIVTKPAERLTFGRMAEEWYEEQAPSWSAGHAADTRSKLDHYLLAFFKDTLPEDITLDMMQKRVHAIEKVGHPEAARKVRSIATRIFRYGARHGYVQNNPCFDLYLAPYKSRHYAALTDTRRVGRLLLDIDNNTHVAFPTRNALKLMTLVFLRTTELRALRWSEIDWDENLIRIPRERMKADRPHLVPLSRQARAVLETMWDYSCHSEFVFLSPNSTGMCLSEGAMHVALRRMGYTKEEQTIHGWRATASSLLNEKGFRADVIEAQLAHGERNKVRASYNHADYLAERRVMMQAWADYLDELKERARKEETRASGPGRR